MALFGKVVYISMKILFTFAQRLFQYRVQGGHSYQVNLHSSYEQSITSLLLKINTGFKRFILYHKHTQTHPFFNITLRIFLQINQQCRKIRVKNIQKTKRNICTKTFCLSFFQVEVGRSVSCTVVTFFQISKYKKINQPLTLTPIIELLLTIRLKTQL